jgi:glucose-1-phosphate thymidylyltransferase
MCKIKGVLLAGGFGTRLQPATKIYNKHLLPIYSQNGAVPMIYYPIKTLVNSGIEEILIISSREHCGNIIDNLSDGADFGADFSYKIQDSSHVQLGIASALKLAENFVGKSKFAMILGDNYFEDSFIKEFESFSISDEKCGLFLKEVSDVERFGCAIVKDGKISKIIEKPKNVESNWAVTGLYLYDSDVFSIAKNLVPSNRGELEITDINDHYCKINSANANFLKGFWSDMGTPMSVKKTQEFIISIH